MKVFIKDFRDEGENKYVGFRIENNGHTFIIDKQLPVAAGKTQAQYVEEAFALAKPEIDAWVADTELLNKEWNPETKGFVEDAAL